MNNLQQQQLIQLIKQYSKEEPLYQTIIPSLRFYQSPATTESLPVVYQSSFCMIIQGKKRTFSEESGYEYRAGQYLLVSVDLPLSGQITQASPEAPYLSLQLDIDATVIRELLSQSPSLPLPSRETSIGFIVGECDSHLCDALVRLLALQNSEEDTRILSPLLIREIHYRLLRSEHGQMLTRCALKQNNMAAIAEAIHYLKSDIARPFRVEELAEIANMSPSSFYQHFKAVTSMSPIQYQKSLRLIEARRLLANQEANASTVALQVGYESPSQFSREYTRMFGAPPIRDAAHWRKTIWQGQATELV